MEFHGDGGCDVSVSIPWEKITPAKRYELLPDGCKISNGMGITVMATAFCAVGAMGVRYLYLATDAARAAAEVVASDRGVAVTGELKRKVYLAMTGTQYNEKGASSM
jgi:hypothetical protein